MIKVGKSERKGMCFNCKKVSENIFEIDFDKKFFNNFKICEDCARFLHLELAKEFVPKGIKNNNCEYKIIKK